jgi:thiol-disulfide isomerase/thioredoxin
MKKILALFLLMISVNAIAQNKAYTESKDTEGDGLIYNGRLSFNDLDKEASFTWLKTGREEYRPDAKAVDYLRMYVNAYKIVVFLGTWCDDSHDLIPKLEKVLSLLNYPQSQLVMYGVDRAKTTNGGEQKTYAVKFVPTIILYQGDREIGRITESVNKSIEADLAAIIKKDKDSQPQHK